MANFKYKARDKFAKLMTGILSAETKEDTAIKLKDMGYVPVSVSKATEINPGDILKRFRRVRLDEINAFTRQFYSLQKAGVPLLASLEAIAIQTKNQYFKITIEEIMDDIRGGLSFSQGLEKHGDIFDNIYVGMVKAAEASGRMVEVLEKLSELIDREIETRMKIKSATRYPLIALGVLCLGFLIVITFVIPRFANLYDKFNAALPLPTRILIGTNIVIKKFWYLCILILGGLIVGFKYFIKSKAGRALWDNFKLKVPVFGPLVSMLVMSRFTRVTAILMKSGVPILEVLDLVAISSGNSIIIRAIQNIRESVRQGKGLSEPMKVSNLFPPAVTQMVAIGEQSGKTDELLLSAADYYDREAAYMINNLTTYIEPILIFILAVMVLVMALGIFMPMWNLIKVFKPN